MVKAQFELSGYDVKTKQTWPLSKGTCESSMQAFVPCVDENDGSFFNLDYSDLLQDGKLLKINAKLLEQPDWYLDVLFDYAPGGFERLQLGSNNPYGVTWYLKLWQK